MALITCLVDDLAIGVLFTVAAVAGGQPVVDSVAVEFGMTLTGLTFAALV